MTPARILRPVAVVVAVVLMAGCGDDPPAAKVSGPADEGKTADPKYVKGVGRGGAPAGAPVGGGRLPKG